jgi:hypothetical protein
MMLAPHKAVAAPAARADDAPAEAADEAAAGA